MTQIPFATNAYKNDSLPVSSQECINAYAERQPEDAKAPITVLGAPGIVEFAAVGVGPIRALMEHAGDLYAISGDELYHVDDEGVGTFIGAGLSSAGPTRPQHHNGWASNGTQLVMVNGGNGYVYNSETEVYQQITDAEFKPSHSVTFFDNYFVFAWDDTPTVFLSALNDPLTYSDLDRADAEVHPSVLQATVNHQQSLLVFTRKHIETWYDSGAVSFPFQRIDGGTIERGLVADHAVVAEDNSVFFLGDDLVFYRLDGVIPRRISTHALEALWSRLSSHTDVFCFAMTIDGHKIVYITFPGGPYTFGYDIATGLWHRRESFDANGHSLGRWRAHCHMRLYNRDFVGDDRSNRIGYMDPTVFTEFGNPMPMILTSPPTHADRRRVFYSNFEVDMETGVGTTTGQGSDPQAMLNWSNDGGRTWSQVQPWRSIGALGNYTKRVRWAGPLGQARQRTWRLEVSDPVKRVVLGARCDVSVGM